MILVFLFLTYFTLWTFKILLGGRRDLLVLWLPWGKPFSKSSLLLKLHLPVCSSRKELPAWLPPMSVFLEAAAGDPTPPLQEPLQDPQVGLAHTLIKLLLLCETLFAPSESEASVFSQPWGLAPAIKACQASKPNALGARLPGAGPPGWGAWWEALNFHSFGRPSGGCNYPPVCRSLTCWCGIWE